jgi:HEAT repeat protein
LGDKRALELGIKYYAAGNPNGVRSAALSLLGAIGKDDPRVLPILVGVLNEGLERRSFQLISAAGEAMVALGDERAVSTLEEVAKRAGDSPQLASVISSYQSRLKARLASTKAGS